MARLDPNSFPDRFALDRYARRMRREETDRTLHALAAWFRRVTSRAPAPATRRRPATAL